MGVGDHVVLVVVARVVAGGVELVPVMHPSAVEVVELGVASATTRLRNARSSVILCRPLATPGTPCDWTYRSCPDGEL